MTLFILLQDFLLELPGGLAAVAPVLSASLVSLLLFLRGPQGLSGDSELAQLKASGGVPSADASEAPLRALAAGLTLAGGNSLGPESPSVEIGANVAANLAGAKLQRSRRWTKLFEITCWLLAVPVALPQASMLQWQGFSLLWSRCNQIMVLKKLGNEVLLCSY